MKNNNCFYKHYREFLPFIHNELALRENHYCPVKVDK